MLNSNRSNKTPIDNRFRFCCGKAVSENSNACAGKAPMPSVVRLLKNRLIVMLALAALLCPFARGGKAVAASLETDAEEPLPQIADLSPYVFPKKLENSVFPQGDLIKNFTGEDIDFFVTDISLSKNEKEVLVTAYPMVDLVLTEEQARYLREGGELTLRISIDSTALQGEDVNWEDSFITHNYKMGAETDNALYLIPAVETASDSCIWPSADEAFKKATDDYAAYQLRKVEDGYVLRHGTDGGWDGIWIPDKTSVLGSPCLLRMSSDFPIEYRSIKGITAQDCIGDGCFCEGSFEWSHPVRMTVANGMVSSMFCGLSPLWEEELEHPQMLVNGFPTNEFASEKARRAAWQLTPHAHNAGRYDYRPWADGVELTCFRSIANSFPEDGIAMIPSDLDGLPVRSIYSKVLYGARGQALVIPDTVERIAAYAFQALEASLVEIQNPNAKISENAFYNKEKGVEDLTIRGYLNSTAEAFAKKYQCRFQIIPAPTIHQQAESSLPNSTPVPMADFEWLENQEAIQKCSANFISTYWSASDMFRMAGKQYAHGVCITMKGSKLETKKTPDAGDVWSEPYAECYVDVPFDKKFFKMTFDAGFDEAHLNRWGALEKNGCGRLILMDMANDTILYDTGIVDYTFHDDWVNLEIGNVSVLRVIYQTSPVTDKQRFSLNLLMGRALLYKLGDDYELTKDYTPTLTALPTDYRQYEASATDDIERFILRGYRERYSREELARFSKDEIELVLNGIYALSGKWFQRAELWNYFTSKSWYYPVRGDITKDEKNNFQNENEDTVVAYMKGKGWR